MDFLADYFIETNGSTAKLIKLIVSSKAYNANWKTVKEQQLLAEQRFAAFKVRRLDSEILVDIICKVLDTSESYSSVIPEPFTYLPRGTRAVQISDGSISSRMLDSFGRPPRDSGRISERKRAIDDSQRLFLMNSGWIYNNAGKFPKRWKNKRMNFNERVDFVYLNVLARPATKQERELCRKRNKTMKKTWVFWGELVWSLVNSKEFIYQH
ncbi:MAG: DUF1553 domain-containing protein [Lentisphaeria bacterium]|nr:DUF1553 domain-containing protein [Lentisphaeria bacterium]